MPDGTDPDTSSDVQTETNEPNNQSDDSGAESSDPEQQELDVLEEQHNRPATQASEHNPTVQPSEAVEQFATYSTEVGDLSINIIPEFTRSGSTWKLVIFTSGQGPLREFRHGLTDEQAEDLGIPPETAHQLNGLLAKANEELKLPRSLRGQERGKKTIDDLEQALS